MVHCPREIKRMKLEDRLLLSVKRRTSDVILRSEISDMASASQVSEALKALQKRGVLVRLGTGVYAKASKDSVSGAVVPVKSLEALVVETFQKLGVHVEVEQSPTTNYVGSTALSPYTLIADTGRHRISRKLSVGSRSVSYVNDRTRHEKSGMDGLTREDSRKRGRRPSIPTSSVGQYVRDLAGRYNVVYTRTSADQWAEAVTRLAGDEVKSGHVQDLLVALKRAGKVTTKEMALLLMNYLREQKRVRSV